MFWENPKEKLAALKDLATANPSLPWQRIHEVMESRFREPYKIEVLQRIAHTYGYRPREVTRRYGSRKRQDTQSVNQ
jgi:hypothetical protein